MGNLMNLEQLCISLDQAKKLKELGVNDSSYFYWVKNTASNLWYLERPCEIDMYKQEFYNAYTSAELAIIITQNVFRWEQLTYEDIPEAQARAEFLIYLLENLN